MVVLFLSVMLAALAHGLVKLNSTTFDDKFTARGEPGLVIFQLAENCGPCEILLKDFEKTDAVLKDLIRTYLVEDESLAAKFNVGEFPTVAWLEAGKISLLKGKKTAETVTEFAWKKAQDLVEKRLGKKLSGSEKKKSDKPKKLRPIELVKKSFDDDLRKSEEVWFVKFYAPWCGHCKALIPAWDSLATEIGDKIKIAKVDATTENSLAQEFGIQGFPTLLLFGADKSKKPTRYEGPRDLEALKAFAKQHIKRSAKTVQLTNQGQFSEECVDSGELCFIAFLPHMLDSSVKERKGYLKTLKEVMLDDSLSFPIRFFWTEAGNSAELEEKFRLQFGWPAVIITATKKGSFSTHRGQFTKPDLKRFITGVASGRVSSDPIPEPLPAWPQVKPWDGKEAPKPADEL